MKKKIIRITTIPGSMGGLLKNQLKFMANYYNVIGVSSKGENDRLKQVGIEQGVRVTNVEMTRTISPIKDLKSLYALYKILKLEKPHIVHTHTPKAGTIGMIASRLANVPHRLHTIAGLPLVEATGFKRFILNNVEKLTYSCATKIYPNSFGLKKIILNEKFTKESKLKVIGQGSSNGIDTSHFDPNLYDKTLKKQLKEKLNITENDFIFIFVGRLVGDKGINELVEAFCEINKTFNNTKLLLVGAEEKKLDPLLPETTNKIKANSNIIETGWANDVRPYLAISDVLTFPSYREGFPNVVMQACAMELACIVSDINGCNEIIKQGLTGFIIPKKDTNSLYDALVSVLSKKEQILEMGLLSRKNIIKNYEQRVVWKAILKEYNQLN
ncbi:glycosyltransferase family 4 protein [Algibacter mikhailovii]|uniref:Glycosyl transferase n=1 Tax=Algibacter mikhailovii TaxID=425498 RepID=A0A918QS49_9FLAO|nr:glycosyltransferase family 4 protein [Algibacter mikhailovii]GGZ70434.1 glycosyl transferase [Algibacter mikhailovii]